MATYTLKGTLKLAAIALSLSSLAACSMFSSKDPRYEPAPLEKYEAGVSAAVRWSVSLSGGPATVLHLMWPIARFTRHRKAVRSSRLTLPVAAPCGP